jgi:hypothetical protein
MRAYMLRSRTHVVPQQGMFEWSESVLVRS